MVSDVSTLCYIYILFYIFNLFLRLLECIGMHFTFHIHIFVTCIIPLFCLIVHMMVVCVCSQLCVQNSPQEARNMLLQNPQLAYALLQAQVVMRIVDPEIALVRGVRLKTRLC